MMTYLTLTQKVMMMMKKTYLEKMTNLLILMKEEIDDLIQGNFNSHMFQFLSMCSFFLKVGMLNVTRITFKH